MMSVAASGPRFASAPDSLGDTTDRPTVTWGANGAIGGPVAPGEEARNPETVASHHL